MKQRLENFIERNYYAAALFLLLKTEPIYVPNFGRINNDAITSHCIYQFTCDCGSNYIGRTERMLKTRVREHIPKWLQNQVDTLHRIDGNGRYLASSIAKHPIEAILMGNVTNLFKVVYKNRSRKMLRFAVALAIRRLNLPPLCP